MAIFCPAFSYLPFGDTVSTRQRARRLSQYRERIRGIGDLTRLRGSAGLPNMADETLKMERYMDLIRLMLIAHVTGEHPTELKEYSDREKLYHYTLLKDAGFIDATFLEGNDALPAYVAYVRVTWQGQEFYDASKESKIWKLAKDNVLKAGASFTATALLEYLKIEVKKHIGVP